MNAIAQDSLKLEQAIQIALENNYNIRYALSEEQIASNNNSLGNAGFLPTIAADGAYSESVENTNQQFLDGRKVVREDARSNYLRGTIGANWFVFDGTRMFVSKEKLEQLEAVSRLSVEMNIINNIAELINNYYLLAAERKTMEVYSKMLDLSQERLKITETAVELGSAAGIESMRAQVDFNSDQSLYLSQKLRVESLMAELNQLMGREVELEFVTADSIVLGKELMYDALLTALEQNPNLSILQKNIEIAELQKKEIRAERYPLIGVNAAYNYLESESEAGFLQSNQVHGLTYGANISIPILNGFDISRRQRNSEVLILQNEIELERNYSLLKKEFLIHYRNYQNYLQMIDFEQKNVQLANENMQISLRNFELGGLSSIELREIQQSYLEAEERLIRAQYQTKASETELLRLSNQLMVQEL